MPGGSTYMPAAGGGSSATLDASAIAKAVEIETGDNLSFGPSSVDGRTIAARTTGDSDLISYFEANGITPVADGSVFDVSSAKAVELSGYNTLLPTGTYTRASLLAFIPGTTKLYGYSIYVSSGTGSFTESGGTIPLGANSRIDRPYASGITHGDFSLVVDATSTVVLTMEAA